MFLLASEWVSRLGGEEKVERAAVSGLQPRRYNFRTSKQCSRVFILAGANPGELTLKIS